jgi:hypothetical protein
MTTEAASMQESSSLATTRCPRCDYDLRGLPPEGICPECGRPYDQKSIILHGWASGQMRSHWWNLLSIGAWALPAIMMRFGVSSVLVVLGFGIGASVWAGRFRAPTTRVKLNEHGCAQYENPSETSLLDLGSRTLYRFGMPLVWGIAFYLQPGSHSILPLLILAGVAGVLVVWGSLRDRKVRARLRRREQYFDEYETPADVIPWTKARSIKVTSVHHGERTRVRIASVQTFWKPEQVYVDAKLICSSTQGSALRAQIERWQAAARGQIDSSQRGSNP